jgi:hypothetical protein
MASLASLIQDSDLDEDEYLQAAIRMSMGETGEMCVKDSSLNDLPLSDDVMLQQALAASLTLSSGIENNSSRRRAASPVLHDRLLQEEDTTQAELMEHIEAAKRQASSSAKKRRKSAKKLAKRNKRNNIKTSTSISASISGMNADELRSELRRLCVPLPWPTNHEDMSALLFSVVDKRTGKKEVPSPIRPRRNSKSQRKSRKGKGAGRGQQPLPSAPDFDVYKTRADVVPSIKIPIENVDTDELLLKSILAQSLRESQRGTSSVSAAPPPPTVPMNTTRHLHQSLAMEEQKQLERAMEENMLDYERQLTFSSLDSNVQAEAEIQWIKHTNDFNRAGGRKPTTDFIVSLAKDIISRQKREAKETKEAEEEKQLLARNSETREQRAARFAAAYEKRK